MKRIISVLAALSVASNVLAGGVAGLSAGSDPDEPVPYLGKSNALHQLVFMDLPGDHRPLTSHDYFAWIAIFGMIVLLILVLSVAVKTQGIVRREKVKTKVELSH